MVQINATFTLNPDTTAPVLFTDIHSLTTLGYSGSSHYFMGASTNWSTARANAVTLTEASNAKGTLAIVSDGVENAFISNAINAESVNEAYLGVYQTSDGQPWIDVNGNAQSYLPWRSDQPSGSNQNAVMLWHDATSAGFNEQHVWSDENENDNHNYVVEVSHFYLSENTTNTMVRVMESSTDSLTFSLKRTDSGLFYLTGSAADGSGNQYVELYPTAALSYANPTDSNTDNEYIVVVEATDGSSNTSSITLHLEVRDQSGPTVVLTDSDADNAVVSGDSVVVTATFSEGMTATPTISISGGLVSNAAMSGTSSSALWTYTWNVSSTVATDVSITVSGTDLAGNAYSGTDSLTFSVSLPDTTPPTVVLTENSDSDNRVNNGDSVVVTATFSEAMAATPTISISGGLVSNAAMSGTSSSALWTYTWIVSTTVSTEVIITVSGTDLESNVYSDTTSLTFLDRNLPDYLPSNGLIAWYPFDGDTKDYSGNSNHGINSGGTFTTDNSSKSNAAIYFSGTSCGTRMDADIDMSSVTNEFTVSFWIYKEGNGCNLPSI